jgi:hypothetical protein
MLECGSARRNCRRRFAWVRRVQGSIGRWLWNLGRVVDGFKAEDLKRDAVSPFLEEVPSGFGRQPPAGMAAAQLSLQA